jgi:membrane protease YdiL (CAAX protease family)
MIKAAFKNASVVVQLVMILAVIAICTIVASFFISILIVSKIGITSPEIFKNFQLMDFPELVRGMQFLQTLGIFLFPAIICAWLFSDNYKAYFGIDHPIHLPVAFWTVVSIIVAIPFLNWTYLINKQVVFPEALKGLETWIKETEDAASQITELMLNTKNISTIILNILIVCVVAGVSEEFMFRGLLQTFFGRIIRNPHIIIWIVAILFSAFHLQFYGFITRMLLGAWFGYLMYYTKTIWIPVLAHFTNNFFSISVYYLFQNAPEESHAIDALGTGSTWWLSIASLALFSFCFLQIKKATVQ